MLSLKIKAFWQTIPMQWIVSYQHFRASCCLHLQGSPRMFSCVVELVCIMYEGSGLGDRHREGMVRQLA